MSLEFPKKITDDLEKENWLAFLREQAINWYTAMSRIKEDEQRWIRVALLIFGGLLAFLVTMYKDFYIASKSFSIKQSVTVFLLTFIVSYVVAWIWSYQALVLRRQYYRTMVRSFITEIKIGWDPGKKWEFAMYDKNKISDRSDPNFEVWYKSCTKPKESKYAEMILIGGLVCATGISASSFCLYSTNPADILLFIIFYCSFALFNIRY